MNILSRPTTAKHGTKGAVQGMFKTAPAQHTTFSKVNWCKSRTKPLKRENSMESLPEENVPLAQSLPCLSLSRGRTLTRSSLVVSSAASRTARPGPLLPLVSAPGASQRGQGGGCARTSRPHGGTGGRAAPQGTVPGTGARGGTCRRGPCRERLCERVLSPPQRSDVPALGTRLRARGTGLPAPGPLPFPAPRFFLIDIYSQGRPEVFRDN